MIVSPPSPRPYLAAVALHLAFGAAAGSAFRAVGSAARRTTVIALAEGIAFGVLVWAVSYAGWIPALRLLPPPSRDRPGRPASMLAAHVVHGGVLGLCTREA